MYEVVCPVCDGLRTVNAKKTWMKGDAPYLHICKICCQVGKKKTPEHKRKLSEAVKAIQTPELIEKKRQYMLDHPELWDNLDPSAGQEAWKGQHHTVESKKKIGDGVRKAKRK